MDDTMLALARGGMKIRGVLDRGQANQGWAAPKTFVHPNIELFVPRKQGAFASLRKLHHKLMVVDECITVAGSFNYTQPANDYNDENIFVLGSPFDTVDDIEVDHAACEQLGKHMKAEIERIISLSEPYAPGSP